MLEATESLSQNTRGRASRVDHLACGLAIKRFEVGELQAGNRLPIVRSDPTNDFDRLCISSPSNKKLYAVLVLAP